MNIADKLAEAANQPLSSRRRLLSLILPVFVYAFFFPVLFFIIPKFFLDRWFCLPPLLTPVARVVLGASLILPGLRFLFWSIKAQRDIGKGTPMPLRATQELVIEKPYSFCRNPLFLGLLKLFFGISVLINSISSLVMVLIFSVIIGLYIKLIEEKELEKRFGDAYLAYKKATPFLIPSPVVFRRKK